MKKINFLLLISTLIFMVTSGCAGLEELWMPSDLMYNMTNAIDTTLPTIDKISPTNGELVLTNFTANVIATDNKEVSKLYISIDNGDFIASQYPSSWVSNMTLSIANHRISAYAVDKAGNIGLTNTSEFSCVANLDPNRPSIEILTPTNGQIMPKVFTANGTAVAKRGLQGIYFTLLAETNEAGLVDGLTVGDTNASWSTNLDLAIGNYTMKVFAYDNTGVESVVKSVFFSVQNDLNPPVLAVNTPTNNQDVYAMLIDIAGTVSDDVGVMGVFVKVNSGEFTNIGNTGSWSYRHPVNNGSYTIMVYAADYSGKHSLTNTITPVITYDGYYNWSKWNECRWAE